MQGSLTDRWHAHHTLYKVGKGAEQQKLAKEGADLLRKYDIE